MRTLSIAFSCLCFLVLQLHATPQIPDELSIVSERLHVHGFKVNDLISKQMGAAETEHGSGYSLSSSANHRGFVATLELKGGKLFLKKLHIRVYSEERNKALEELSRIDSKNLEDGDKARIQNLHKVIQNAGIINVPLKFLQNGGHADWFSGNLYHYYGEPLSYTNTHRLEAIPKRW